jgi:ATP-dependent DNA ligase
VIAKPFHRDGWVYKEKVDGWRMLAYKDGRRVRLVSRRVRFSDILAAVARRPARRHLRREVACSTTSSCPTCIG